MRHVSTAAQARELSEEIVAGRPRPLVLISTTFAGAYEFDPDVIASRIGPTAEVVTAESGDATRVFEAPPLKTRAFNGAARVFHADGMAGPIRFMPRDSVEDLIGDVPMEARLSLAPRQQPRRESARIVSADPTLGVFGNLDNGALVKVVCEGPDDLHLAVDTGVVVEGELRDHTLHVLRVPFDPCAYPEGTVTLGLVTGATERRARIILHPDQDEIVLRRRDVFLDPDDADVVSDVVSVGDVVRVGVRWEDGEMALSLVEVDGELTPPAAFVAGGLPWLSEHDGEDDADEAEAEPTTEEPSPRASESTPAPAPSISDRVVLEQVRSIAHDVRELQHGMSSLHSLVARLDPPRQVADAGGNGGVSRAQSDALKRDLAKAERALAEAREARTSADRSRREAEKRAQTAEARLGGPSRAERQAQWPSVEQWLRHEIYLAWVGRVHAGEKARMPLPPYDIGPDFPGDLTALTEPQFGKTLRAIIDVLTGRAEQVSGRDLHRLRTSDAGGSPYVTREDGASAYRCAIEINTPSARRLHYWQRPDGVIELARAREHDASGM
ncbi:hypothetical protein [Microbacterium amylolyticum]|uniref:S1 motif domain-containing protein n=1 Tax=Microbacterium amylolyticum TaxID=936337 RepID=A0ABS4ZJ47_9MICO|nr:hypothetical protein [Microbacterium amylolyticum]MBP2437299.1 hypothetical protein [Microbacterium amylolyticum]